LQGKLLQVEKRTSGVRHGKEQPQESNTANRNHKSLSIMVLGRRGAQEANTANRKSQRKNDARSFGHKGSEHEAGKSNHKTKARNARSDRVTTQLSRRMQRRVLDGDSEIMGKTKVTAGERGGIRDRKGERGFLLTDIQQKKCFGGQGPYLKQQTHMVGGIDGGKKKKKKAGHLVQHGG